MRRLPGKLIREKCPRSEDKLGLHILSKRIILRLVKNKEVQQNGTDYQRHHDR